MKAVAGRLTMLRDVAGNFMWELFSVNGKTGKTALKEFPIYSVSLFVLVLFNAEYHVNSSTLFEAAALE